MLSKFYNRFSIHLLCLAGLLLPYLLITGDSIPSNNDIETWLRRDSTVRSAYDDFKSRFGAEELILIGLKNEPDQERLVEAVCQRVEQLPGIRKCWSPSRMAALMSESGVTDEQIEDRLTGLSISDDGRLIGLVALLSAEGLQDRAATVDQVREQLDYCQLSNDDVNLAGAPVVVAELDRLGNRDNNKIYFVGALLLCQLMLYAALRDWKLTLAIVGLTIFAINLTLTIVSLAGGEMNFILDALPVMVMVFTMAIAVHILHYYASSLDAKDPLGATLRLAWKPCCLATLTTSIGLISLTVSAIGPVSQFGYAAALGSVVALVTGLGLMPAVLTVFPPQQFRFAPFADVFAGIGDWLLKRSKTVACVTLGLVAIACVGLFRLDSKIDPLDFLPKDGTVLSDVKRIQRDLTNTESIEAVVDFGDEELPFVTKLERIRKTQSIIESHPAVRHSMSLATFFPEQLPEDPYETLRILNQARKHQGDNDFLSDGERLWRISIRIHNDAGHLQQETFDELVAMTAGVPIIFTGISPLLERAQHEIFEGFWESFAMAFGIITLVMLVSLKSAKSGLIAMIPNLTPICIVFGTLGWIGFPVDIGTMMSGSIALGIAVDGTFHFLVRYQEQYNQQHDSRMSARIALLQTGPPILQATIITSIGMLALTFSSFGPTVRFGFLMATMLAAALIGDLVLLPSLLYLRPTGRKTKTQGPHFRTQPQDRPASRLRSKLQQLWIR